MYVQYTSVFPEMHIIHFDAHTDLREDYLGAKLSHACVIRRCHDMLGDGRIHQFCIRSGEREEFAFAKEHTDLHPFDFEGLEQVVQQLKENNTPGIFYNRSGLSGSVCISGNRNSGGRRSHVHAAVTCDPPCIRKTKIVGADLNELAPMLDQSGVSTATACKVLRNYF